MSVTYERYQEYCQEAGITNPNSQQSWVRVLHELGVILNYRDDKFRQLESTHVLKPEWVTDGVYSILSDPKKRIKKNGGILNTPMLDTILDTTNYPRHQHHFIIEMMCKFELSFRIPNQSDKYLIPDLLRNTQPDLDEIGFTANAPSLKFEYHYTDFLPDSILSRLMVRMMGALDRQASWQTGAVLEFDGNRALVRSDADARKITITITSRETTRRSMLDSIRVQIHAIHSTFPSLKVTEHVPINDQGQTITYHALHNLESKGYETYYDANNDAELNVKELLAGIETPALRQERQLQERLQKEYSMEEIKQLCFELNVDDEDLAGTETNKTGMTRAMVKFMKRHGRLDKLEETLKHRGR